MGEKLTRERTTSIRASVNWTVLGLVIERPSYGYELWQRFERQWGDVIDVSGASAIYHALNQLKANQLIEAVPAPRSEPPGRQPKPWHCATEAGVEAYEAWVIDQAREHSRRSLQFARQLAAFAQQPDTALGILGRYEQACLDDRHSRIPTEKGFQTKIPPGLAERLESAYGRSLKTATLSWIEYARQEFLRSERETSR